MTEEEREHLFETARDQILKGAEMLKRAANEEDDSEVVTEWAIVFATVDARHEHPAQRNMYYRDSDLPMHWGVGLLDWGLRWLRRD